ncbi:MAG: iron ABC transporter permease [Gammaproteobacteria bacterium]
MVSEWATLTRVSALVAGLTALLLVSVAALQFGAVELHWHAIFDAYLNYSGSRSDVIVRDLRAPGLFVAVEVGAALAVAGGLMQGVTRNPLADPGILGVNAGAAMSTVVAIGIFHVSAPEKLVWYAFPGAVLGTVLSFSLALAARGRMTPLKLTLAGVITASMLGAATALVVLLNPSVGDNLRFWFLGDVNGRSMHVVLATAPFVVVGLVVAVMLGRSLNALSLGEDTARSLGQNVTRIRITSSAAAVLLAGGAVAAAGPIGFVGLAVPNGVRLLVGNDYRWILPLSAIYGAAFGVAVNLAARVVLRPETIETGVAIALIGTPIFLVLVSRRQLAQV